MVVIFLRPLFHLFVSKLNPTPLLYPDQNKKIVVKPLTSPPSVHVSTDHPVTNISLRVDEFSIRITVKKEGDRMFHSITETIEIVKAVRTPRLTPKNPSRAMISSKVVALKKTMNTRRPSLIWADAKYLKLLKRTHNVSRH